MKQLLRYLPYLPWTVWFNFRYLPLRQAVRLPILLRKPRLLRCGGRIRIEGPVHTGMVRLGVFGVSVYPDRGIAWECDGTVTFAGRCSIGNDSYVAVGHGGCLRFGRNFRATAALRAVCYHELTFGDDVLVGWDNTFCDTDLHRVKSRGGEFRHAGYAPIRIGRNNWFAMKCTTLKGARTPDYCIVGAASLLSGDHAGEAPRCLLAGNPARLVRTDVYRDSNDDKITYNP